LKRLVRIWTNHRCIFCRMGAIYASNNAAVVATVQVPAAFLATGYTVYVYTENAANGDGRPIATSLTPAGGSASTFYYSAIAGSAAGQIDGGSVYNYLEATNTTAGNFSQTANYALFPGLNAASFSISVLCTNSNATVSGIEIVQAPEPAMAGLMAIGAVGFLLRRRKTIVSMSSK
jgi:hypothetical protein